MTTIPTMVKFGFGWTDGALMKQIQALLNLTFIIALKKTLNKIQLLQRGYILHLKPERKSCLK